MNIRNDRVDVGIVKRLVFIFGAMLILNACTAKGYRQDVAQINHTTTSSSGPITKLSGYQLPKVLDPQSVSNLESIIGTLSSKRVVFIGETHDRFDHHLNQLEIIHRLHDIHPNMAIGMEFFQQPFQSYLDQYVAGEISEKQLLKTTEYYDRWRFDYRLYRPILRFARERRIPIVALNLPREITSKVAHSGLTSLTAKEKEYIPSEIDRGDNDYRQRLQQIHEQHPELNFNYFFEAQLLWDEGMAEQAADYLRDHPEQNLVVLAGSGHLSYGSGIPQRLSRRIELDSVIVINGLDAGIEPRVADYLLFPQQLELPAQGLLGIYMKDTPDGVTVSAFSKDSGAKEQGMEAGDQIIALNGESITSSADVKIAMLDKRPGESVTLDIRRKSGSEKNKQLSLLVGLR